MAGKVKGFILILLIVSIIFSGYKMIPPYFNNYQLQDDLDEIARVASYRGGSDEELKGKIITKAQSENITLREDQITISRLSDGVGLSVHYPVHVDLLVKVVDLDFTTSSLNKRL